MGHTNRDSQVVNDVLEVFLEQVLVATVTPTAIAQDKTHWYNPAAFAAPGLNSDGTESSRDQVLITGPAINNFDLSLSKKFFFWEKMRIEARLDAFNALNHTQGGFSNFFSAVYAAPGSSTITTTPANETTNRTGMAAISGYRPNRQVQWMLRFEF